MIARSTIAAGLLTGLGLLLSPGLDSADAQAVGEAVVIESVFVRDMALSDFAELMTRGCAAEWKVLVSEKAGDKRISFYLSNTGIEETLRSICATYGLWYRRSPRSDIVQIVTMEEYRQGLNLYADEAVEVVPVMYPAPEEIGDALARLFQDRVVWDPPPEGIADDMPRIESALDRMDTLADRATMVGGGMGLGTGLGTSAGLMNVGGRGGYNNSSRYNNFSGRGRYGGSRGGYQQYGGRYGESYGQTTEEQTVEEVVKQQARAMEAEQAARGVPEEIGGKNDRPGLVYISASSSANALVLRSSDTASVEMIKNVIRQLDKPKPQVLLEVKVFDLLLSDKEARGVDWLFKSGEVSGGFAGGITPVPGNALNPSDAATLIPQGTGLDPRAVVFTYVSDQVRARIQLLQDEQRLRSVATPSLLVADNEASRIFIGSEVTVLEKVEQQQSFVGEQSPTSVSTFEVTAPRRRIGTTLLLTPKIHADRTVTIRLLQEETELGPERTVNYGETRADQFTSQDINERSVITTVLANDGDDVAIGGLIRRRRESQENGVPGLMRLPLLGGLFKRKIRLETQSELLVLIRPRVLLAPGEGATASQETSRRVREQEAELKTQLDTMRGHDSRLKAEEGEPHEP